ncbi:unnamed protein product [Urochloa humidicola]
MKASTTEISPCNMKKCFLWQHLIYSLRSSYSSSAHGSMLVESFPSKLNMLKNDYKQIKGSYQPYNSVHVILDLQKKVYKIGQKTKLYRRRWGLSSVLVTVFGVMALTVWGVHGDKEANKKALTELQQSLAKTESDVEKLKKSINESKKIRVVSNAAENH